MVVRAAGLPEPPAGYAPPFLAGQFSLNEHYLNARKAAYGGLLDGLEGIGPTHNFSSSSTRGIAPSCCITCGSSDGRVCRDSRDPGPERAQPRMLFAWGR
jgi:hypothetical protein